MDKFIIVSKLEEKVSIFFNFNIFCSMFVNEELLKNYINVIDYCNILFKY